MIIFIKTQDFLPAPLRFIGRTVYVFVLFYQTKEYGQITVCLLLLSDLFFVFLRLLGSRIF